MIYKDLMDDFQEYFQNHRYLLPEGVILENINIIGEATELPEYGKSERLNWKVVFKGYLGNPQWIENYDLFFDGLQLIEVRKSITAIE